MKLQQGRYKQTFDICFQNEIHIFGKLIFGSQLWCCEKSGYSAWREAMGRCPGGWDTTCREKPSENWDTQLSSPWMLSTPQRNELPKWWEPINHCWEITETPRNEKGKRKDRSVTRTLLLHTFRSKFYLTDEDNLTTTVGSMDIGARQSWMNQLQTMTVGKLILSKPQFYPLCMKIILTYFTGLLWGLK